MYLVDDGSDHDHDSHIMVWQVRDQQQNCNFVREIDEESNNKTKSKSSSPELAPKYNKIEVESRSSRASTSSVDLGPTPGSGLVTTDASEISDNDNNETSKPRRTPIGVEMTESMTTSSLMQFNRDVESMLEHSEHAVEHSEEPKEDFTQHLH